MLSTTVLATAWFASHYNSLRKRSYRPYGILNNGTHDFRQTLIMISLDGTVNDYLDRGITPNLDAIGKRDGYDCPYWFVHIDKLTLDADLYFHSLRWSQSTVYESIISGKFLFMLWPHSHCPLHPCWPSCIVSDISESLEFGDWSLPWNARYCRQRILRSCIESNLRL